MPSAVGGWREQYQVGAGSGAPSLADADPCLPWQAPAWEGAAPQLDSALPLHACRDQLATYLLIIHYPCKKIMCTANLI